MSRVVGYSGITEDMQTYVSGADAPRTAEGAETQSGVYRPARIVPRVGRKRLI